MWSRKPMPVEIRDRPSPSRFTAARTSVSLVLRVTSALRMAAAPKNRGRVLPASGPTRQKARAIRSGRLANWWTRRRPARYKSREAAELGGSRQSTAEPLNSMNALTAFGLFAVTAMLVTYALERRSPWFTLAFAGACVLGSTYGFLQGAWPFGLVEAIWAIVALNKWRMLPSSSRST